MMTRWLLACSVMLLCLLAFGCGSDLRPDNQQKAKDSAIADSRDLAAYRDDLRNSLESTRDLIENVGTKQTGRIQGGARSSPSPKSPSTNDLLQEFDKSKVIGAIDKLEGTGKTLDKLEIALRHTAGAENSSSAIAQIKIARTDALTHLEAAASALSGEDQGKSDSAQLNKHLKDAKGEVESALIKLAEINNPVGVGESRSGWLQMVFDWAPTVGIVIAAILILVLLVFVIKAVVKLSSDKAEARIASRLKPLASNVQKQHEDFVAQLAKLTSTHNDLRSRFDDFELELKRVSRIARDAANDGMRGRLATSPMPVSFREVVERVEPTFPISTGDYLNKMQRSSNIVRPDFQNDILVNDPDGTGELVLIRDVTIPDDLQPLFIVPRFTQFQTKQDFYTYYQKYYDCDRPSAGDVWIIDPAVVSKVSGGWQLREKGVLEIR